MAGTLFVVATPIGNLEDITLRALRVLREADVIAAEDTRRTAKLLTHFGIETPRVSFHQHNVRSRLPQLLHRLQAGESVAVVTDAGTPSVSDPGAELVRACIDHQIAIEPIPGANAHLTAAVVSGFPLDPWTILGFAPNRAKDRSAWLQGIAATPHTVSFFEAPHRIDATLRECAKYLGDRPLFVGRELTKAHQQFVRGTAAAVADTRIPPRGEFTIVVGPAVPVENKTHTATDSEVADEFRQITESGEMDRRSAVRELATRHSRSPRDVYAAIERAKSSG
jgi:16S rRNA (cytidine1402-2'-O)-methyltransferase